MEGPVELQEDWELLHGSQEAPVAPHVAETLEKRGADSDNDDDDDGIRSDYFSLDSDRRYARRSDLNLQDDDEVHSDSDKPSWVDPDELKGKISARGGGDGEFWTSDESSDEQKSPRERQSSHLDRGEGSELVLGFADIAGSEQSCGGLETVEGSGDEDAGSDEKSAYELGDLGAVDVGGEKKGVVWWKLPVELLKFCLFKVRPVWPITVAAALLGFVVLGRKLYSIRRRGRNLPLKVTLDDKKASLFSLRAAHLNEAFSVVKRMPIVKLRLPPSGVTPWPVMALR